jgi:nicotinamidase-related amidase
MVIAPWNDENGMREAYFTASTLREKSLGMLPRASGSRRIEFVPEDSALLVIDMQNVFLDPTSHAFIPAAVPIVPKIKALMEAYRRRGLPIIFTRHANTRENAALMGTWWRSLIPAGSPESDIIAELDDSGAMVVDKIQYDAFYRTALDAMLRSAGVRQLVITGVMTHLCCETTARSAFVQGYAVFLPVDGTAAYTEEQHRATLISGSHGFAVPVLADTILEQMEG